MNPADRRIVHKVADEHGLNTESQGEGRDRHVVLSLPKDADTEADTKAEDEEEE